ncbi:hypothetical protein MHA_0495 [Mannheimia haemolytica PHL213]|nr:hypothetical protein MHA_0495 [Mannheimia haemolytica PHL213]
MSLEKLLLLRRFISTTAFFSMQSVFFFGAVLDND